MKNPIERRNFITRAAGLLLGVHAPRLLAIAPATPVAPGTGAKTKNVIFLYMDGGMSHLDTLDPKKGEVMGGTKTIKTSADGILLSEYLPHTAKQMHHATVIRSLTSTQGAHQQGNYFLHTSYQLRGTIRHPSLGAWLSHFRGDGNPMLPKSVYVGGASRHPGAGFLPPQHQTLYVSNPENGLRNVRLMEGVSETDLRERLQLSDALDAPFRARFPHRGIEAYGAMYDSATAMMRSADISAFDLTKEKADLRARYGNNAFGQGCLLARRLVERGVRFVEVSMHGWDTHAANFVRTPENCAVLDKALATLVEELNAGGLLKETLVVLATEFGRTPHINGNTGRDHYPKAFSFALFGGGVRPGSVYGKTNAQGAEVEEGEMTIPDFNATLALALGLPVEQVVMSPTGRPFKMADKGKPVSGIFA
jgi:hypothetical protein